ncbi:hypothetical protein RB608_03900 [Nocardioides sp. LHD-245]|uniref:sensor histidine kinase n=1 Tax=Nocardioides sp. LHD-245 TaxID=3051387 RepID=UPI0027DF5067|nr:hypothetical protein [Nocardioides sp. LHD-245]
MDADLPPRMALWRQRMRAGRQPVVAALVGLTLLVQAGAWWTIAADAPVGTALAAGLTVAGGAAALLSRGRRRSPWWAAAVLVLGAAVVAGPWLTPPTSWSSPWWPMTTASLLGCLLLIDGAGRWWSFLGSLLPVVTAAAGLALTEPADGHHPIGTVLAQAAHHAGMVGVCAAVVWAISSVADLVDQADLPGEAERLAAARSAELRRIRPELARQVHDRVLPVLQMVAMERADVSAETCRENAVALRRHTEPQTEVVDLVSAIATTPAGAVRVDLRGAPAVVVPRVVGETMVAAVAEAVRNVARHAGVTRAVVEVGSPFPLAAGVRVRVIDQGDGFDPAAVPADRHGLAGSIRDRMLAIGGTAAVDSAPGWGTTVTLGWRPPSEARTGAAPAALGVAGARRLLWPTAVHPAANLVAVAATAGSLRAPVLGVVGATGLLAVLLTMIHGVPRRRLSGRGTTYAALAMVVCVAAAGAAVAPGASDPSLFGTGSSAAAVVAVVWAVRPRREAVLTGLALTLTVLAVLVARFSTPATWWVILAAPLVGAGVGAVMGALIRRAGHEVRAAGTLSGYRLAGAPGADLRRFVGELDPVVPSLLDGLADGSVDPGCPGVRQEAAASERRVREGLSCLPVPRTWRAVGIARDAGIPLVVHLAADVDSQVDDALAGLVEEATDRWLPGADRRRAASGERLTVTARRSVSGWRLSVLRAGPGGAIDQQVLTVPSRPGAEGLEPDESVHRPTWRNVPDRAGSTE